MARKVHFSAVQGLDVMRSVHAKMLTRISIGEALGRSADSEYLSEILQIMALCRKLAMDGLTNDRFAAGTLEISHFANKWMSYDAGRDDPILEQLKRKERKNGAPA